MNKQYLAQEISKNHKTITLQKARLIVDLFFQEIIDGLLKGERVEIRGFGSFSTKKRAGRVARNPKTNEKLKIADRAYIQFRAGKVLLGKINSKKAA
ncbi:MAG: integration host factor subunit beta [Alphaproteobacteria bacterium]|nr:integration host factor subunit beta [Alphaproteobacteria bacterium]OJV17248.1 MAG: hypothetical protein BGO27_06200 [Alphaproteobacteria bacterium 33-17]